MCTSPLYALLTETSSKNVLKILPRRPDVSIESLINKFGSSLLGLPCGSCPECLLDYRKHWAMRCEFESKSYDDNCFITLTYDESFYPGKLVKSDISSFIKSLRNRRYKFRYFGCSEQGESYGRFHFHIILFGFIPDDLVYWSKSKSGNYVYRSSLIETIWSKGFCYVENFNSSVGAYVAGYTSKKLGADDSYLFMSRRPGIGYDYIVQNLDKLFNQGYVSKNGHIFSLDRYIEKVADSVGYDYSNYKQSRIDLGKSFQMAKVRASGCSSLDEFLINNQKKTYKRYRRMF